ncbi:hypothetical protein [Bacteriophage Eos]|nr:hypothetical protein [Bacteriophage Eos]
MANDILVPDLISPEGMEVISAYLENNSDPKAGALALGMEEPAFREIMRRPEVKTYLNEIFMESGFRNRDKFFGILDTVLNLKMTELEDSGMGSEMDIMDILKLMHKMKMDEMKMQVELEKAKQGRAPASQNNTQINIAGGGDSNYMDLMTTLMGKK